MGATPCCHTQLIPVLCGQLAVQCASWTRRCALGAPLLCSSESTPRPPSLPPSSISTSTSAETSQLEERAHPSGSLNSNRGTPCPSPDPPQLGHRVLQRDQSRKCVPLTRSSRCAVPVRSGRFSPPLENSIPPWRTVFPELDELLESFEQVREES
ncbi:Hypothetical predicted protein [Scomber scombrus]|uniref:Uncharacterized protein n=1 Tax=Scomber scombrus TaxID=13677 RepID=A0AAV1NT74_SCOSC